MQPIDEVIGRAYPLGRDNVDTDLILPGRFLKTVTRSGLGKVAFEAVRAEPGNVFADPTYSGASILISGKNFGCGSSREHAVWAMADMGIRVVIAESFSDIFAGNAFKNGMLAIEMPHHCVEQLLTGALTSALSVNLDGQTVGAVGGVLFGFYIDAFRKDCLLKGLDEIELTLEQADSITAFENRQLAQHPWLKIAC